MWRRLQRAVRIVTPGIRYVTLRRWSMMHADAILNRRDD